jgi:hypothetical protein
MSEDLTKEEEQMIRDAEEELPKHLSSKNICTLKNPNTGTIIMMTSVDVREKSAPEAAQIFAGAKNNLITAMESQYFDLESVTEEMANAMCPAAYCKVGELPEEIEGAARESLLMYGDEHTYICIRMFEFYPDEGAYAPVPFGVKNKAFCDIADS